MKFVKTTIVDFEGMVKHFMNLSKADKQEVMNLFMDGIETKTEKDATILTASEIEEIKQRMVSDNQIKILFNFNHEYEYYQVLNFKDFSDIEKYYTIKYCDKDDYSVYLAHDEGCGVWLPIIFIREFWDFYSNYDHNIKEEETKIETTKTDIEIIADNLIEYIDKIQDIITNFINMGLPKEDISFIIQKAILSWTETKREGAQKWTIRN